MNTFINRDTKYSYNNTDNIDLIDTTSFINKQIESVKYYYNQVINNPSKFFFAGTCFVTTIGMSVIYDLSKQCETINKRQFLLEGLYQSQNKALSITKNAFQITIENSLETVKIEYIKDTISILNTQKSITIEQIELTKLQDIYEAGIAAFIGIVVMTGIMMENNPYNGFNIDEQ